MYRTRRTINIPTDNRGEAMKYLMLCLLMTTNLYANDSADEELMQIHLELFSEKEILKNPSLCNYYNTLAKNLKQHENITCRMQVTKVKNPDTNFNQLKEILNERTN
jgi:hypothetical protein